MNIKLSNIISDAAISTLDISVFDSTMCISKYSSATHDGPLTNGGLRENEPQHFKGGSSKTAAILEHYDMRSVPTGGCLTSLDMEALCTRNNLSIRIGSYG